ncbi:MAG: NAD-dependent DNA ligase LigA [bacterium]
MCEITGITGITSRVKKLISTLNRASKTYYQENYEIMSDFEYDKLYDELLELENKYNIKFSNSPTLDVGYEVVDDLKKIKHGFRMLSLDKTKSIEKLEDFLEDRNAILSHKMDGLTIVLKYDNNKLINAITRGNGEIGEDITHNVKVFKNIPLEIPYDKELIIRGEALISFEEFELINQNLEPENKYKNPRNLCSGSVRQLNSEVTKGRNVDFLAFSLINNDNSKFINKSEQLDFLKSIGFQIVDYYKVNKSNIKECVKNLEKNINNNIFATDGLVLTFDDIAFSQSLGHTSKFPKDSIAFKWADSLAETILLDVEWNTSRTGLINPVAIFEPVELEGTTVNRASLHNVSIIKNLKLGIGDTISVYKANMIIPQVAENITKSDSLSIPETCNICNEKSEIISIRDGLALKCTNNSCSAKVINQIIHYVSRDATNIESFSKATIEKFIKNNFIKSYSDIYYINNFKQEIINMTGFGEKSYNNLINSIEKSKSLYLYNFVYALGIDNVGLTNAKLLSKNFNNNLIDIIKASKEDLLLIDGFGDVIANSIKTYFSNQENLNTINKIFPLLDIINESSSDGDLILKDLNFVITGKLEQFKNRKELQSKIEELGGKITPSVSQKTNYLINNDKLSSSSKNKTALKLDVKIINEKDFIKKFL